MTDYLDELLEQQVQEETGEMVDWHKTAIGKVGEDRRAGAVEQTMERQTVAQEARTLQPAATTQGTAQLLQQVQRLHRAVRQAEKRESRSAAPQAVERWGLAAGSVGTGLPWHRAADHAEAVDRAFQRDARRYDGPMELPR